MHSYTSALTLHQADKLKALLAEKGFAFSAKPYTIFFAQKNRLSVAVYQKGPKVVIQGSEVEDFIRFELEPKILEEARFGYEEILQPQMFAPHFGIDESGKGDFFGPLVIAGAYVDSAIARRWMELGVVDSKKIGSDRKVEHLAELIRGTPETICNVVLIGPARYNELYGKFRNLNELLAWGHARVIENLLQQKPDCPRALSDKFGNERLIQRALLEHGKKIQLDQRTKAESDVAVAAASILAREKFVGWLRHQSRELGVLLPKGVSEAVKLAAKTLVQSHGPDILKTVAKTHFRTAAEVVQSLV